jgi:hypothetical protein
VPPFRGGGQTAKTRCVAGDVILNPDESELGAAAFEPVITVMTAGIDQCHHAEAWSGRSVGGTDEAGTSTEKPVSRPARGGAQSRGLTAAPSSVFPPDGNR